MKAVLLEVSHLHFPPYIKDLFDEGIKSLVSGPKAREFERNILSHLGVTGIMIGRKHLGVAAMK